MQQGSAHVGTGSGAETVSRAIPLRRRQRLRHRRADAGQPPIVRNDELWFYYGGYRYRNASQAQTFAREYLDSSAIGLAKLRLDGFCSLKGGIEPGSVLTKKIEVDGSRLHLNVNSWRGHVAAELLDAEENRTLPGYSLEECVSLCVNQIGTSIRWKTRADLSELRGKTIRVRFSLLNAELYAFWFGD